MKLSCVLPLTLLCASTTVFSQNLVLKNNRASLNASPLGRLAGDCPIGLLVDHGSAFEKREVAGVAKPGLQQQVHLTITNLHQQKIVGARLTVHGLSQKSRFLDVSAPVPDRVKSIKLSLDIEGNGQGSSDLSLPVFAVVTTVDIAAVTYADGSAWTEPSPAACSVTPNALMRVSTAHKYEGRRSFQAAANTSSPAG